jgi:luciferase family oxidoreductase group 1
MTVHEFGGELEFSILDYVYTADDMRFSTALANSVRLARVAEVCGYSRYWIAEHHAPTLEIASPEVTIAAIAAQTRRIRVGSACVLLSYYSPRKVAHTFYTLSALFPGRIDLGIGRGRAGVPEVEEALMDGRPKAASFEERAEQYRHKAATLVECLAKQTASDAAQEQTPTDFDPPEVWMHGSGTESAELAARHGARVCLATFFGKSDIDKHKVLADYRTAWRERHGTPPPAPAIALSGVCAETDAEAQAIRAGCKNKFLAEQMNFCGAPGHCRDVIFATAREFGVNHVVLLPMCDTFAQQERAYRLLSEALRPRQDSGRFDPIAA